MTRQTCPDPVRLKELIDGSLPADEQTQLSNHLETCLDCQKILETVSSPSLAGIGKHLREEQAAPEEALQRAMQALKEEASEAETLVGPKTESEADLDFLTPSDQPGQLGKLGTYEIVEVIGRGGMGVVLKARDPALQRLIGVKVLASFLASNPTNRKRFIREARAAAAVNHENVVRVYSVDETGPLPFLVMEYIRGVSLQQRIDEGKPPELSEIVRIGAEIAQGLAAAHAQGLVHRDIKPGNILLEEGASRVKITDFGLARAVDDISLTQSGAVAGTPQYMAPEQARGEAVDARADLFSLGSVLYALCTGKAPFKGDTTVAVLFNVCQEVPTPIQQLNPAIPDWLVALIEKLHSKVPIDRYQSAVEASELLRQCQAHLQQPHLAPLPGALPRGGSKASLRCKRCGKELYRGALVCSHCGVLVNQRVLGYEYKSQRTLFGMPLVHVVQGVDPVTGKRRIAKGIIAVGDIAIGVVAVGGVGLGGIALGGVGFGLISFGGLAIGLLLALGGLAVGCGLSLGGGAVGLVALGGGAVGYYALGGTAYGVHALGSNVQDREAIEFFRSWLGSAINQFLAR